ncbi:Bor family protein [Serratia sp. (in: enterobacteria)]|uniref:Bor family protein n=1 Tax=Serratia sp. (in: enterobacteria) TaxID=616 RepID=UPI003989EC32
MNKLFATAIVTLLLTGCAQQTFNVKSEPVAAPKQVTTHHFFVSGIGQQKTIDAAAVCGSSDKVVRTEVQQTFVNGLLGVVTLGIYTPREARVYCAN